MFRVMRARLRFDPAFVEEAVFLKVRSLEESGETTIAAAFFREKDRLYESGRAEQDFRGFYGNYFWKLGLAGVLRGVVGEFPYLDDPSLEIVIRRVYARSSEGSELFIRGGSKTAVLGLLASRARPEALLCAFLRHELLRISDMVDPSFDYDPSRDLGEKGSPEVECVRRRFAELWDRYIAARLRKSARPGSLTQMDLLHLARNQKWELACF